ncbi:MAG TPA: ABC transporter ATP-binding protein [Solirubrobacterales bacterium]|nr:ABC transporter ATP-binding protein [Solirubrobacterales bacterium]
MPPGEHLENDSQNSPAAALTVENLQVSIATGTAVVEAVRDVSFRLKAGSTLGLLGISGSGKSVTGLSLLGLPPGGRDSLVRGSIRLGEIELTSLAEPELRGIRGGRIAMVFQDPGTALTPVHRVGRLLDDTVRAHHDLSRSEIRARSLRLLDEVGLADPEAAAGSYVQELSGGMKQRVMIAIALAGEPSVLIADEPTSALDAIAQDQILDLIESIQRNRDLSVLLISHDLGVMTRMADRITVIDGGRTVEQGNTRDLLSDPRHPVTRALLESQRRRASRIGPDLLDRTSESIPALRLSGIEATYPKHEKPAVRDVSLTIAPGEVLGLVGESGCGKTTLARCVLRIMEPAAGAIEIGGRDVTHLSDRALRPFRNQVGAVFQSPGASLNPKHTVSRILQAPLGGRGRRERQLDLARAVQALESVGLERGHLDRMPSQLSGGQQQRVALARALITEPRLLVCDEPFTALDVSLQNQMAALLKKVQVEFNLACLLIAHDLDVIGQIADRVAVMHRGRIIEVGETEMTLGKPREEFTRRLVDASQRNRTEIPARPSSL